MKKINHFIDGKEYTSLSKRFGDVYNPALGEKIAEVSFANSDDVEQAIISAKNVFSSWSKTPPLTRSRIFFKFKELLVRDMDKLAAQVTEEHGKVISDSIGSITRGMEVVEFMCGVPHLIKGEFSENVGSNIDSWSMRQPLGICVGITPFNFPAMVPMWMFVVAIACGNCFILKPSEKDPSLVILLGDLLKEAGLPDGVFNVVNGDKEAVDCLITHSEVSAVSFVGSTPIAEYIYHTSSQHNKRVQALGGAKNHMVIMPDADLDQVADGLMGAAYGSAGERCMALSVAVAVGGIGDALIEKLQPRVQALKVGPGNDLDVEMGPLISGAHLAKVKGYVESGVNDGASLLVDGRDISLQGYENGFFIGGCLFDNVTSDMQIYKEEIFGPVLSVVRSDNFDSALKLVNEHEFGNGVTIYTRDGDTARAFSNQCQIGMVGINVPIPVPMAFHSFGGWKRSLFGDHAMHGMEGIRFFTKLKTVTSRWPDGIRSGAEFIMPTMK
ncbi:CoA-acylating methylmalonate-semialdehyde dehydrogenase [Pelagibacteraceae bacterium]|nr:CoA-acylating methylmalonate-semialdehyde dehydrogenase [Pelagibacteraceae bacterium]